FLSLSFLFFFNDPATTEIYTLSLHDALPILELTLWLIRPIIYRLPRDGQTASKLSGRSFFPVSSGPTLPRPQLDCRCRRIIATRSEEHTSELQSPCNLVCRLLLEKKKKKIYK